MPSRPASASSSETPTVAVVGAGFIGLGMARALLPRSDLRLSHILTRRPVDQGRTGIPYAVITNSLAEALESASVVFECSGDVQYAAHVIEQALTAHKPVVTIDSEFHVTIGSALVGRGYLTEGEGDQPGCLAALLGDARAMGFSPLVLGNQKRYLDLDPPLEAMRTWSAQKGVSVHETISFTDGTKIAFEQALVANGLDARIAPGGMLGVRARDRDTGARAIAQHAFALGATLSDYILSPDLTPGVFVAGTHVRSQVEYLRYLGLGDGPFYVVGRDFHLCHLEAIKTVLAATRGRPVLLNNTSNPRYNVGAVAKHDLPAGHLITRGIGSLDLRGEIFDIRAQPNSIPLGLLDGSRLKASVTKGQMLLQDDIDIKNSRAYELWTSLPRGRTLTDQAH